ncbi:MacB family efflux pump subunit [Mesorhizobium sangaii]|uniref:Pyoverdine export ATP-binding/permease protein PvdT n=1 Tax=Mesorhizobium sangaii TaxID=505389 RepID=A0A841PF44_9HYPH|nr:MacB family efflux pump subunit [Mesorhizobium sangaii]MBB6413944.1 macrolide transport system ATP-binding/permease protein [Mesorhizobium sangaii]
MSTLLEIKNVSRVYQAGDETIMALAGVSLSIASGELVAIVGASGSGKTTLMNILGCLDQPSSGDYRVGGRSVAGLTANDLAALRREHFGFIFQRYHLLGTLNAADNVAMPAVYAGVGAGSRRERSTSLLRRLGLGDRLDHRPNQLSGGQQQRVSIARALMNGGRIILADEPTGALDNKSGETVLDVLKELYADGHTIIIVTHDMGVAGHADRIIEIRDGFILSDRRTRDHKTDGQAPGASHDGRVVALSAFGRRLVEAFPTAKRSRAADRARTFLTMLGILIGIAAVVGVVGIGEGTRQTILGQIGGFGASSLRISPGRGWGDERASSITTLVVSDADALAAQSYVDSVTPEVSRSAKIHLGRISVAATVIGVSQDYFRVYALKLLKGSFFSAETISKRRQEAVISDKTAATLFPQGESPLGRIFVIDQVPVVIVGVFARPSIFSNDSLQVLLPYTAVNGRLQDADSSLDALMVRVADSVDTRVAERAVVGLMTRRHGTKDFVVDNIDQMRKTMERTSQAMSLLISSVAVISLVVGGIGVMNIMLVSVTERTREIGLRMAVGARRSDIMLQFLIEAVTICIAGSILGVALALGIAGTLAGSEFPMIISVKAIVAACVVAFWIGLTFGFLPARNASRLNPVDALSRD